MEMKMEKQKLRKPAIFLTVVFIFLGGCAASGPNIDRTCNQKRSLRHVVLFAFKNDTSADRIKEVTDSFERMAERIDHIHDFEWGRDISNQQRNQGFTHCFILTFRNTADLAEYQPHPLHEQLKKKTMPYLEKVLVIDYWKND